MTILYQASITIMYQASFPCSVVPCIRLIRPRDILHDNHCLLFYRSLSTLSVRPVVVTNRTLIFVFSGFLQRHCSGVLHNPLQHGVGTGEVDRMAHHLPSIVLPVRHRGAAFQGKCLQHSDDDDDHNDHNERT